MNRKKILFDITETKYDRFATRQGEDEVAVAQGYHFRRMPSEQNNGLNTLTMWCHGGDPETTVILDNILIVGPVSVGDWALFD